MVARTLHEADPLSPKKLDIEFVDGKGNVINGMKLTLKSSAGDTQEFSTDEQGLLSLSSKWKGNVEIKAESSEQ